MTPGLRTPVRRRHAAPAPASVPGAAPARAATTTPEEPHP